MPTAPISLPQLAAGTPQGPGFEALADLARGEIRTGYHDRMLYSTDASIYQVEPIGVAVPADIEDACQIIRWCGEHRVAMLPRGGGTSLAGQCVNRALAIDLSAACNRLISFDAGSRVARVEPGITIDDLNDEISSSGLFFAPDPSTARHANIGGCIGNNAAGSHSVLYGRTSDSVASIDVCLWDGSRVTFDEGASTRDLAALRITEAVCSVVQRNASLIKERFPKTLRRSAGYQLDVILEQLERSGGDLSRVNLAPLLCGSEGTLAVTLGAALRLHPIPRHKGLAVVAFESVERAIDAVVPLLELEPSAIEMLDDLIVDLARQNAEQRRYVELLPRHPEGRPVKAVLYVEFYSDESIADVRGRLDQVAAMFPKAGIEVHTDPVAMDGAWKLRKAGEPLLHAIPGKRKPLGFVEDNAVPPERLGEFVAAFRTIVEDEGTIASFYAHASVGVLHVRPLLDLSSPVDEAAMHRIAIRAARLAKELGGVMSGEHGDGRARGPLLEDYFGPELMQAFREIKQIFDPHGLLNPGNIVMPGPIESVSENTRIKPYDTPLEAPEVATMFRFEDQGGLMHAAEMCNGAGVCRKKSGGTMCPSYQATLDERHATRGRGNALRLAMTGQVDPMRTSMNSPAWGDLGTHETLRLCLSCKACKTECPSNVDISRLKAEYLYQSYKESGSVPLQARVFSSIHRLNKLASIAPGLTNLVNKAAPMRSVINRVLGIDARRSLPEFRRAIKRETIKGGSSQTVVVLSDSFTSHNDTSAGRAVIRVLSAFGYTVEVVPVSDLGRAAISTGMLDAAVRDAERTLDGLRDWIASDDVVGFVVCEPSCLSSIKDDWLDLRIDRPIDQIRSLAERSWLPEQFLNAFWEQHPERPLFDLPPGRLLVHGHCHQKALWGLESSTAMLERIAPGAVVGIEAGCCGMAGSFGYTSDRYDLSMKIGEMGLFPAVRSAGEQDWLLMPGTSCRHQTLDGTGRATMHPIEAIDRMMSRG